MKHNQFAKINTEYIPAILILIVSILWGCSKEDAKPDTNFIIGHKNLAVEVVTYDPPIQINTNQDHHGEYIIDMDSNRISDIAITSDFSFSSGGSFGWGASIGINNMTTISTIEQIDTSHICYTYTDNKHFDYVYYNSQIDYTCTEGHTDSITSINIQHYPRLYNMGDTISETENWLDGELILSYYGGMDSGNSTNRTRMWFRNGNWNNQGEHYLLFRRYFWDKDRYGWLKISISNNNEIQLYEYAIQR